MSPSRLALVQPAVREPMKGRMMLSGPTGSGKTRTGLIVATELAEGAPILGIDTEKGSMRTYADDFSFLHLPWNPPFDPRELTEVLREARDAYAVIFVDSASHFWRKEGGTLDIAGGRFTGWKDARPVQEALVEAILDSKAHIILGVRSKMERVQEKEGDRYVVHELGMADQQDDDLAYELNVAFLLEKPSHTATVTKSRAVALPVGRSYDVSKTSEMARTYREWLKAGELPAPPAAIEAIRDRVKALPAELSKECQDEFVSRLCKPIYLRESQLPAAETLVAKYEERVNAPAQIPIEAGGDAGSDQAGCPVTSTVVEQATPEKITKAQAGRLHTIAKDLDETTLRILVHASTGGVSDSASDVTVGDYDRLVGDVMFASDGHLPAGYADMADAWAIWQEGRAQQAGEQDNYDQAKAEAPQ